MAVELSKGNRRRLQIQNASRNEIQMIYHTKPPSFKSWIEREGQRDLRGSHFMVKSDDNGSKYVIQVGSEVSKNHQCDDDGVSGGIMYANNSNPRHCPVRAFELYLSKANRRCDALFQRPRDNYSADDDVWFENKPIGKNTLSEMMALISKRASLSQRYTNHCIHATSITIHSEAGFNNRHIMSVSRHRNEGSIRSYVRDTSIEQKKRNGRDISICNNNDYIKRQCHRLHKCP
ncbi:uncharacterized protein LOC144349510 [Saccoglossus kowalevskii]